MEGLSREAPLGRPGRLGLCLLAVLFVAFFAVTMERQVLRDGRQGDLDVFLRAAWAARTGADLYQATDDHGWHYLYPPLFATLLTPLADPPAEVPDSARTAVLPYAASAAIWYWLNVFFLALALHVLASALERKAAAGAAMAVPRYSRAWWALRIWPLLAVLVPAGTSLGIGQSTIIVLLLLCLSAAGLLRGRRLRCGFWLGFAGILKLFPLYLLIYPLWRRDGRMLLGAAAGLCLGLAIPVAAMGPAAGFHAYRTFLEQRLLGEAEGHGNAAVTEELHGTNSQIQSFEYILYNSLHPIRDARAEVPPKGYFVAHIVVSVLLSLAVLAFMRRRGDQLSDLLFLAALALLMVPILPVSRPHYYALGAVAVAGLLSAEWPRHRGLWPGWRTMLAAAASAAAGLLAAAGQHQAVDLGLASLAALWLAATALVAARRRGAEQAEPREERIAAGLAIAAAALYGLICLAQVVRYRDIPPAGAWPGIWPAAAGILPLLGALACLAGAGALLVRRLAPAVHPPALRLAYALLLPCVLLWPGVSIGLLPRAGLWLWLALLLVCLGFELASRAARSSPPALGRLALDETGRRRAQYSSPAPCSPIATPKAAQISGCTSMGTGRGGGEPILRNPHPRIRPPTLTRPHKGGGNRFLGLSRTGVAGMLALLAAASAMFVLVPLPAKLDAAMGFEAARALAGLPLALGAPFGQAASAVLGEGWLRPTAIAMGGIGLAALAFLFAAGRRAPPPEGGLSARRFAQLLAAFGLIGAPAVAATAAEGRLAIACLFWFALPLLLPARARAALGPLAWPAVGAVGVLILASTPAGFDRLADHALADRRGLLAAAMGKEGPPTRMAVPWTDWPGQPASRLATGELMRCAGALDRARPLPRGAGMAVEGWISHEDRQRVPSWVALAGRDGRVIGLAAAGARRPDIAAALGTRAVLRAGFEGFIRGRREDVVALYGWFADGIWCRAFPLYP